MTPGSSFLLSRSLDLESVRIEYAAGNQCALALAIHLCGERGLLLPPWVVKAWRQGCYDIVDRKVESWDEVLTGRPGKLHRKTVKDLTRERTKAQKMFMIRFFAYHYREIPISNKRRKLKRVGNTLVIDPDRFETIAQDLTAAGKREGAYGFRKDKNGRIVSRPVSYSEARDLWYEQFPGNAKHKKGSK